MQKSFIKRFVVIFSLSLVLCISAHQKTRVSGGKPLLGLTILNFNPAVSDVISSLEQGGGQWSFVIDRDGHALSLTVGV